MPLYDSVLQDNVMLVKLCGLIKVYLGFLVNEER
jgi:hypothetical protein